MWGLPAALGVYVGAILALPKLNAFSAAEHIPSDYAFYLVKNLHEHTNESLRTMSIIYRERLYRTFFPYVKA